jgi:fructose-1-phosphate kinase PfkB-like protein
MQALKVLVPRHQPIVAAPHAAEIARLAASPAHEWRDPSIALAAREHHQRAQLQVASMRRQGIVVLDEADNKLDKAVLDSYLLLRRRKRI